MDDQGPAPQQLDAGVTDGNDDSTVSGIIQELTYKNMLQP